MIRTALVVTAALLSTAAVSAADLYAPATPMPIMESHGFSWDGLYIGARAGGEWYTAASFGVVGGVVGFNFLPSESFLVGLELSGDYTWNNAGNGADLFANVRAGFLVTDAALVYAIGGLGAFTSGGNSVGLYQLGGGVEFAVTDSVTVRGELTGEGSFTANSRFFNGVKATAGVSYHF